jgi:hypothetical protein
MLAGVDQVGVLLALERERAGAEHAVLGLQLHLDAVGDVVGDQGGDADAEIDGEAVFQFAGGAHRHLVAAPGHYAGSLVGSGRGRVVTRSMGLR